MTNKTISLVLCLTLSLVVMTGCGQPPTVEATLGRDLPTPASTSTPTPLPSPTATVVPPATPTHATDETPGSGVQGQVLRGPMCGGPVRVDDSCPDQPFSATFYVLDGQGNRVTSFRTDEQGYFQIALPPGAYTVVPDKSAPLESPGNQAKKVVVQAGELVQVTWTFDTGMR